ncbi:MAG: hypothetical protein Q3962_08120 [Corynebacterium sp.]|nr:hypothetical protein [Corynebacterium sp.]
MNTSTLPIVIAVGDQQLHPELQHIIAATGRDVIDLAPDARLGMTLRQAHAVIIDSQCAAVLGAAEIARLTEIHRLILVAQDIGSYDAMGLENYRIPAEATRLLEALVSRRGERRRNAIGIIGAVGGAGCSTFAAALAVVMRAHQPVVIDGSARSGGLDLLLGMEEEAGARWQDLNFSRGQLDPRELADALPQKSGVAVLSHSRGVMGGLPGILVPEALPSAIATLSHTGRPLVVDMSFDQVSEPNAFSHSLALLDLVVVLVPLEVRAVAAAHELVMMLRALKLEPLVVGVNRTWSGLIVDDVETVCAVECLGEFYYSGKVARGSEMLGIGDVRLPRSYRMVLEQVAEEAGYG